MTNKIGRPTKYSEEMLNKAKDYLEKCRNTKATNKDADMNFVVPYIEYLALECDVDTETIMNWVNATDIQGEGDNEIEVRLYPEFFDTIKRILDLQKLRLMQHSLTTKGNVAGSIFQLKANHGLKEVSVVENINDTPTQVLVNFNLPNGKTIKAFDKPNGKTD